MEVPTIDRRAQISIVTERDEDREAILELLSTCGLPMDDLASTDDIDFLVAVADDTVIGCVGIQPAGRDALLRSLAISALQRGVGTGSRLLLSAEEECRRRSVHSVYLLTLTAESFFARHGYEKVARQEAPVEIAATSEFASICPVSSVCMAKQLEADTRTGTG